MAHFVLADCNNFYASCERLFNPKISSCPVIVLSNNDGCVVARSQEAKQLGIKMGEPYFKIKDFCRRSKVVVFSSNYQLYGDLSQRVMSILCDRAPEIEVYSIDEAFLKYPDSFDPNYLFEECIEIRRLIKKWTGIPVSLGIAPTKTLAKAANHLAKKNKDIGVFNLSAPAVQEKILKEYDIGDIWGIGSRLKARLNAMGIRTAWEFREMDPTIVRSKIGVVGERMLWELRGISCLDLEEPEPKKSIACSRSFGRVITEFSDLAEALSTFANTASIKLRQQNCCASSLCVYVETLLDPNENIRRHNSKIISFPMPTNDTSQIITAAKLGLKKLYYKERYKKCGIILLDLIPEDKVIPDLFLGGTDSKRTHLMRTVDALNAHFGKNTIFYGAMGINKRWKMRSENRSRCYTTRWEDLAIVKSISERG